MKNYLSLYLKLIIISFICFLLLLGSVIGIISIITTQISWNNFKKIYSEEFVLNQNNVLSYNKDNTNFIVDTIYNEYDKQIFLNTPFYMAGVKNIFNPPNNYYMSLYFNKDNPTTGIFIDPSKKSAIQNPIFLLFAYIFLGISSINYYIVNRKYFDFFRINGEKVKKKDRTFFRNFIFCLGLFLFSIGISTIISVSKDIYSYMNLRLQNNIVISTNYSKLYLNDKLNDFIPITQYTIDDKNYIHTNTYNSFFHPSGITSVDTNNNTELFYDIKNPSNVIEKNINPNLFLMFLFLSFGFFGYKISIEPLILKHKKEKEKNENTNKDKAITENIIKDEDEDEDENKNEDINL